MNIYELNALDLVERGDLPSALQNGLMAAKEYFSQKDFLSLSRVYLKLAMLTKQIGDPKSAESFFFQAWTLGERSIQEGLEAAEAWTAKVCHEYAHFLEEEAREWEALEIIDLTLQHLDAALERVLADEYAEDSSVSAILELTKTALEHFDKLSAQFKDVLDRNEKEAT